MHLDRFSQCVKILFSFLAISIFVIMATGCENSNIYSQAEEAFELGQFGKTVSLLEQIPGYKAKKQLYEQACYKNGEYMLKVKKYEEAIENFEKIPGYMDADEKARKAYLEWAEKLAAMKQNARALEIYRKIGEESRIAGAMLKSAEEQIDQGRFKEALASLESLHDSQNAAVADLSAAAEKGSLYQKGVELIAANDFSTARKAFEKAVKIKHNKLIRKEAEYLGQYCEALRPVVLRMGEQGDYAEVLSAVYPVRADIAELDNSFCKDCLNALDAAADKYLYAEVQSADWHQKIDKYEEKFKDTDARCNVFGGLFKAHLKRTGRLINILKAAEQIKGQCSQSRAYYWDEAKKTLELNLSTMLLDWKNDKNYKMILMLQQYVSTKLNDLGLDLESWRMLKEDDLQPEFKFNAAQLGENSYMISGYVKNPSAYRPLNVKGISIDCEDSETGKVKTECSFAKHETIILPSEQKTMNARAKVPAGVENIVEFKLKADFEKVDMSNINAEDLFERTGETIIKSTIEDGARANY